MFIKIKFCFTGNLSETHTSSCYRKHQIGEVYGCSGLYEGYGNPSYLYLQGVSLVNLFYSFMGRYAQYCALPLFCCS